MAKTFEWVCEGCGLILNFHAFGDVVTKKFHGHTYTKRIIKRYCPVCRKETEWSND
jgi:ribosomal protein L33